MKSIIAMLFLSALAVYARAEMEYHPQAILSYLEMEDREMARKVRSQLKLNDIGPSVRPSILPTGKLPILPTGKVPSGLPAVMPPKMKKCIVEAMKCHKKAAEDACEHLKCIKLTGCCLREAQIEIRPPPFMRKCLPVIPCCMLGAESCEEKLCCFVRFGECLKKLGDKKDAE